MRRISGCALGLVALGLFFSTAASANKVSAADYPLRVHVVYRNGTRHYHGMGADITTLQGVDGLGQGNLFENGQPLGFDFTYSCSQPITPQSIYETFIARWKNQGRVLEIAMPVIGGKPGDMNICDLKVTMKQDTVYLFRAGGLNEEPAAEYKQWMSVHQYDPEHGNNLPVNLPAARTAAEPTPSN